MLNIASFTFNFDHVEDRILLVGNLDNGSERIDFWLTRKLVLRLLNASGDLVKKTSDEVALVPKEHQAELTQFHHETARQSLPVEGKDQALISRGANLLSRLDISYKGGQYSLKFFSDPDEACAVSYLTYAELHQVLHLLHRGALSLEWGVSDALFLSNDSTSMLQ